MSEFNFFKFPSTREKIEDPTQDKTTEEKPFGLMFKQRFFGLQTEGGHGPKQHGHPTPAGTCPTPSGGYGPDFTWDP